MCTSYYVHYHHLPTCYRPVHIALEYAFCPAAINNSTSSPPQQGAVHHNHQQRQRHQQQQPCEDFNHDPWASVDLANPCTEGGCCTISPECASGLCRLNDLGGRWACCSCGCGGNTYRWCRHRMKKSPDTFCYHTCCENCRADLAGGGGSGDSNRSGARE